MTIFAILMQSEQPAIKHRIMTVFPLDNYQLSETQWLISAPGTVMDISTKLGIADPNDLSLPSTGSAIIFATSSYYGRAPQPIWDWIKAKLEGRQNG
jgi:hypothetical protein